MAQTEVRMRPSARCSKLPGMDEQTLAFNRRSFLECFSAAGLGLMPGALLAVAQDSRRITPKMVDAAGKIAGVSFTRGEQQAILARLNSAAGPLPGFDALRHVDLGDLQPAFVFNPVLPGNTIPNERRPMKRLAVEVAMPKNDEELAFLPVHPRGLNQGLDDPRPCGVRPNRP